MFRKLPVVLAVLPLLAALPATAQTTAEQRRMDAAQRRYDSETATYKREQQYYDGTVSRDRRDRRYSSYQSRDDRSNDGRSNDGRSNDDSRYATNYDASRHYRDDPRYQERTLSSNDQVYRGSDGRYYCKRNDGTTGLIVGGVGGAVAGNVIDGGHNRVAGTLIGGALGALLGKAVDQGSDKQVRCR